MKFQFRDLQAQYNAYKTEIDSAIQRVLSDGQFIEGKEVRELEHQLAKFIGVKHCITCANGTEAMTIVLKAWNIGEGDAVFVPNFTFFSTAEVVAFCGATPIFVDVCRDTFNMDSQKLEEAILSVLSEGKLTPKVVIPVDLFGLPADHQNIDKIAKKYNLLILEDGAQGIGGSINGKMACSFGDAATTSFFPAKPLGCYGDGGAIFTNNDELAIIVHSLKVHGRGEDKYDNIRIGVNSRLDTIQAAILQVKLKAFIIDELEKVNQIAFYYHEKLNNYVEVPTIPEGYYSSYAQYTLKLKSLEKRDGLHNSLKNFGIPSMIYYKKPLHQQKAFSNLLVDDENLSVSIELSNCSLSLPMHPYMNEWDVEQISKVVIDYLTK